MYTIAEQTGYTPKLHPIRLFKVFFNPFHRNSYNIYVITVLNINKYIDDT